LQCVYATIPKASSPEIAKFKFAPFLLTAAKRNVQRYFEKIQRGGNFFSVDFQILDFRF
jgi:hypothetical protein